MESQSAHIATPWARDFSFFGSCRARGSDRISNSARREKCGAAHTSPYLAALDELPTSAGTFFFRGLFTSQKTSRRGPLAGPVIIPCALRGFTSTQDATQRGATSRVRAGCKFVTSRLLATIALFAASTVSTHAQTDWTGAVSSNWFLSPQLGHLSFSQADGRRKHQHCDAKLDGAQ